MFKTSLLVSRQWFLNGSRLMQLRSTVSHQNPALRTSLTGRFNNYIFDLHKLSASTPPPIHRHPLIATLHELIADPPTITTKEPTRETLAKHDQRCRQQIDTLAHADLLRLMVTWATLLPQQFHTLHSYTPATERLCATYSSQQPAADFLTICHLLGAAKKRGHSAVLLEAFVRRHFNKYADNMSTIELAIVATAAFRTAIRMQPNHGERFERAILAMNADRQLDVALLVTFVKTLRLARIRSASVARQLADWMHTGRLDTSTITTAANGLQFRGLAHLFVYYADNRDNDPNAVRWLTVRALDAIRYDYAAFRGQRQPIDMRAKDFAMVLWCMAQLNVQTLDAADMRRICDIIKEKCTDGEYERDFDGLVDATLSLWMVGMRSRALVNALFNARGALGVSAPPAAAPGRVKLDSRKRLLYTCVELERADWCRALDGRISRQSALDAHRPAKEYLLRNAHNLLRVRDLLREAPLLTGGSISVVQPIRDLNLPGLLLQVAGDDGCDVRFVEVCEAHTTLSDSCTPFGLLALKVRLLRSQGYCVELVNPAKQGDAEILATVGALLSQTPR